MILNEGLVVPRIDFGRPSARAVLGSFDIGLLYDHGLNDGAEMTAPDMPRPNGDSPATASAPHNSFGTGDFRVGLELDVLVYDIPWTETWTCVDDCWANPDPMTHVRSGHAQPASSRSAPSRANATAPGPSSQRDGAQPPDDRQGQRAEESRSTTRSTADR